MTMNTFKVFFFASILMLGFANLSYIVWRRQSEPNFVPAMIKALERGVGVRLTTNQFLVLQFVSLAVGTAILVMLLKM